MNGDLYGKYCVDCGKYWWEHKGVECDDSISWDDKPMTPRCSNYKAVVPARSQKKLRGVPVISPEMYERIRNF